MTCAYLAPLSSFPLESSRLIHKLRFLAKVAGFQLRLNLVRRGLAPVDLKDDISNRAYFSAPVHPHQLGSLRWRWRAKEVLLRLPKRQYLFIGLTQASLNHLSRPFLYQITTILPFVSIATYILVKSNHHHLNYRFLTHMPVFSTQDISSESVDREALVFQAIVPCFQALNDQFFDSPSS